MSPSQSLCLDSAQVARFFNGDSPCVITGIILC